MSVENEPDLKGYMLVHTEDFLARLQEQHTGPGIHLKLFEPLPKATPAERHAAAKKYAQMAARTRETNEVRFFKPAAQTAEIRYNTAYELALVVQARPEGFVAEVTTPALEHAAFNASA